MKFTCSELPRLVPGLFTHFLKHFSVIFCEWEIVNIISQLTSDEILCTLRFNNFSFTVSSSWALATANCCFTSLINWSRCDAVKLPSDAPDKSMLTWCDQNYRRSKFRVRWNRPPVNEKKRRNKCFEKLHWMTVILNVFSIENIQLISFSSNE